MLVSLTQLAFCWTFLAFAVCARDNILVRQATASPTSSATSAPTAISISPSQNWDGPDGPWSTFAIRVGTPEQTLRVLVSTASPQTWVVLEKGCLPGDDLCTDARGGIFYPENSTTWVQQGDSFYKLQLEQNLVNSSANGLFGNDTIGLSLQGSGGPTLKDQVLGGVGAEQYYLGLFGVNPKPTNYSALGDGQASYMTSLKDQKLIPSVSFSYSAGAPYRLKKVLASLTLGGYDESRFTPNDLSFEFAPDNQRDLVVGIQSITSTDQGGTTHNLLPSGILAYVDSTVPQIWLPSDACRAFEKAFGLTYNEVSKVYPVNDTLHKKLLAQNANITFTLGNTETGGKTVDIVLPYQSFDLQASTPFVQNNTRYFPLQQADNETQYTLGRTFLQEAYLIVDWERSNFSLSQCLFVEGSQPNIVAIEEASTTASGNQSSSSHASSSSGKGKTVGIAVGVAIAVVIIAGCLGLFFYIKRKRQGSGKSRPKSPADDHRRGYQKAELNTDKDNAIYEMDDAGNPRHQGHGDGQRHQPEEKARYPQDRSVIGELNGDPTVAELSQSEPLLGPHEMYGSSSIPVELGVADPSELHGSNPISHHRSSNRSSLVFHSADQSPVPKSVGPSLPPPPPPPSTTRLLDRRVQSQPSTSHKNNDASPSQPPPPPPSSSAAENPSPSQRANEPFSPISPLAGETPVTQAGLFSFWRSSGTAQARRSSSRPSGS